MYQEELSLLRSTRSETIELVEKLSEEQLRFSPKPGLKSFEIPFFALRSVSPSRPKWSTGEVLDHLILFEKVFRQDISFIIQLETSNRAPILRLGFEEINVSFGFIPRSFLPLLEIPVGAFSQLLPNSLVEWLTQNRLLPAQNPDVAAPRKGRVKQDLLNDLRASVSETEALFEANPHLDYREMFRQHPTTGRQNVLEAVRMIALHEKRHHSQIREILADQDFPGQNANHNTVARP